MDIEREQSFEITPFHNAIVFYEQGEFSLRLTKQQVDGEDVLVALLLNSDQFNEFKKLFNHLKSLSRAVQMRGEKIDESFQLGDGLVVSVNWRFSGMVDLRYFWKTSSGELKPTKRGISYSAAAFELLAGVLVDI
jgi:hypothetical protein